MATPSVLVLFNQPLLPVDHPDAASEHTIVPIADGLARILRDADYRVTQLGLAADPALLWHELQTRKPDVVLNLFEGNLDNPETETYVAGLLEWSGIPYTGSPVRTLALARAKHLTKHLFQGAGLPTAAFVAVNELPAPEWRLDFPAIVKPATQDASVGLDQASVCTSQREVESRVRYILETYGPPVLIEEYIAGREFNVALVELPELEYMPAGEITFPAEKPGAWSILTYDGKWNPGSADYDTTPLKCPADLPAESMQELGRLAMAAYRLLGCRDYARVDFRMNASGKPYILEVNPNPEISDHAGFAGCLGSTSLTHRDFVVRLIRQALSRASAAKPSFRPASRAP